MNAGPWLTLFVSIFLGTVGVQILGGKSTPSPFSSILEAIMNLGGAAEAAGVIAFTASLAAIMSTADSLIIAISQLITAEVVYPLRPNATPGHMMWAGRIASLITTFFALLVGILWQDGITELGKIQFPLTLMVVPSFLWGPYAPDRLDAHPWCICVGTAISSMYVILVFFLYIDKHPDPAPIEAGITGLCIQLIIIVGLEAIRRLRNATRKGSCDEPEKEVVEHDGVEVLHPGRPLWDLPHLARFGDRALTPRLLKKFMVGVREPITNLWYVIFLLFSISLTTPLVPEFEPPLQADGTFAYQPAVVNGLPWWAFKVIVLSIVPYVMIFAIIAKIPDDYPHDEKGIEKHGIDPDVIELTPKELGHRTSYDSRNDLASRRQTITKTMAELGIAGDDQVTEPTPGQRRLSALVLGQVGDVHDAVAAAKIVAENENTTEQAP